MPTSEGGWTLGSVLLEPHGLKIEKRKKKNREEAVSERKFNFVANVIDIFAG